MVTITCFYVCYTNSVSFIEFLRIFCIHDESCIKILCSERIIKFERLKLALNLHSDKTDFTIPMHAVTYIIHYYHVNIYTAEGISNPNTYQLVSWHPNGHGALYLSANNNAYYVAVDSDNKVQALSESEIANVSL